MSLEETIIKHVHTLPEPEQAEVLNFIEYLQIKAEKSKMKNWTDLSLSSAMCGMEHEQMPYSLEDLRETFL
jgi:hypothetical protein